MSRISQAFKDQKAFIPYITAGYPNLETTEKLVLAMADQGADVIEIGIPFSDPTAEGPVIQHAIQVALENGQKTDDVFDMVVRLRKKIDTPLVFMTYANIVYGYGLEDFMTKSQEVGIDGVILPDIPYEEKEEFQEAANAHAIDFISLIAPTSKDRIEKIARDAQGFVYLVSSLGVTGTRSEITTDISSMVDMIKAVNPKIPVAIGFGISNPDQAQAMAQKADGVIVGSAIIKIIDRLGEASEQEVGDFVSSMKAAANR